MIALVIRFIVIVSLLNSGILFAAEKTPLKSFKEYLSYDIFKSEPVLNSESALTKIALNLKNNRITESHFEQKKKISALTRPLVSKGYMFYAEGFGLFWKIESPFLSYLRLTKNKMEQKSDNENWHAIAEGAPEVGNVTSIFLALLRADINLLSNHFVIYFQKQKNFWLIGLEPKSELLKKMMTKVLLKGNDFVQEITYWESNGDYNFIRFLNPNGRSSKLTLAEKKHFIDE